MGTRGLRSRYAFIFKMKAAKAFMDLEKLLLKPNLSLLRATCEKNNHAAL